MATIQLQSPGAAFGDSIATSVDDQRKRALDLQAQAKVKSDEAYRTGRAQREDSNADRSYALQAGEAADAHAAAGDNHLRATSELEAAAQKKVIEAKRAAFEEKMNPLLLKAAQIDLKIKQGDLVSAEDRHTAAKAQAALTAFETSLETQYGKEKAKAEADDAAARVGLTRAQTTEAGAETNRSNAEAYRALHPAAPKMSYDERREAQEDALANAIGALSPVGQKFYEMLNDDGPGRNPPTRVQALMALKLSAKNGMPQQDVKALEAIITAKDSTFMTSTGQNAAATHGENVSRTQARQAVTDARSQSRTDATSNERNFTDTVEKSRAYKALPPTVQQQIRTGMVTGGLGVQQVLDQADEAVKNGKLDPGIRDQIKAALSGG